MNLYAYGASSPVVFVDFSGNEPLTVPVSDEYRRAHPLWKGRPTPQNLTIPRPGTANGKRTRLEVGEASHLQNVSRKGKRAA